MKQQRWMLSLALLLAVLALGACATAGKGPMGHAVLTPISGSSAKGTVHFQELAGGGVELQVDLTNVPPGVHGFHLHDKGDCAENGNAAGGHFNPSSSPHGAPDAAAHHAGDWGNVTADANGVVHTTLTSHALNLTAGDPNSAIGHAIILHANPDDLATQPSGNAGPRIACGVVTLMAGDMHH